MNIHTPNPEKKEKNSLALNAVKDVQEEKAIPRIVEAIYKLLILIRVKNKFISRTSLKKPPITNEDRMVYVNDMTYNSQIKEKNIFYKKYFEKNVKN